MVIPVQRDPMALWMGLAAALTPKEEAAVDAASRRFIALTEAIQTLYIKFESGCEEGEEAVQHSQCWF